MDGEVQKGNKENGIIINQAVREKEVKTISKRMKTDVCGGRTGKGGEV